MRKEFKTGDLVLYYDEQNEIIHIINNKAWIRSLNEPYYEGVVDIGCITHVKLNAKEKAEEIFNSCCTVFTDEVVIKMLEEAIKWGQENKDV